MQDSRTFAFNRRPTRDRSRVQPWSAAGLAICCAGLGLAALAPAGGADRQDPVPDTLPEVLPVDPPVGLRAAAQNFPLLPDPNGAWQALGRKLFFDPILSSDRSVSCASCHQPDFGFADPRPLSVGVEGRLTLRHAPTLLNRALGQAFMWDGSAATLEEQVLRPIVNPLEMDLAVPDALARLAAHPVYSAAFEEVTGSTIREADLSRALATFVQKLWHADSAVDHFRAGQIRALSSAEKAGMWVYESRGGCWRCHSGANFTDESFHNTGVGVVNGEALEGRMGFTGRDGDRGAFKTPTLRGLRLTAPYMHDGSLASLEEVVEFYRRGGEPNPDLDDRLKPLELTDEDAVNLVAFLNALSRVGGE